MHAITSPGALPCTYMYLPGTGQSAAIFREICKRENSRLKFQPANRREKGDIRFTIIALYTRENFPLTFVCRYLVHLWTPDVALVPVSNHMRFCSPIKNSDMI